MPPPVTPPNTPAAIGAEIGRRRARRQTAHPHREEPSLIAALSPRPDQRPRDRPRRRARRAAERVREGQPGQVRPAKEASGEPSSITPVDGREVAGRAEQEPERSRRPGDRAECGRHREVGPVRGSSPRRLKTVRPVTQATTTPDGDDGERRGARTLWSAVGSSKSNGRPTSAWNDERAIPAAAMPAASARKPPTRSSSRAQAEDATARPEPGHQADDGGDRGEERTAARPPGTGRIDQMRLQRRPVNAPAHGLRAPPTSTVPIE